MASDSVPIHGAIGLPQEAGTYMVRDAARVGDHRRSQKAWPDVHRHGPSVPGDRRNRSGDHAGSTGGCARALCFAGSIQPHVHDAWHDHDFFRGDAGGVWLRRLSCPFDDRHQGHGLPSAERMGFLDHSFRRRAAVLQFHRRRRVIWSRQRAGCGLVGICAAYVHCVFERPQHGLLDDRRTHCGLRVSGPGRESGNHDRHHALPRHDRREDAAAGLDVSGRWPEWCCLPSLR